MKKLLSLGIIILSTLTLVACSQDSKEKTNSPENKTEQSSTKNKTEKTKSSTDEKKNDEVEQEIKNDGPEYTEQSNTLFATHLTTEINNQLGDSGYQVLAQPVGYNVIYLYVPQDIKYMPNAEIQAIADALYSIKESTFTNWAIDNGFDLGFTNSPDLYIKSEDDTTLAEESGILEKSMKVKVNN